MEARKFLTLAKETMDERGKTYDKEETVGIGSEEPKKERSMDAATKAFNTITSHELTAADGWLFMLVLKQVRQYSAPEYHADSALDSVAYSALLAEAQSEGEKNEEELSSVVGTRSARNT